MTKTKLKSLCLREHEVRALLADGRATVIREMKPQPAYPGVAKIYYGLHPFAPSTLVGTPAEGIDVAPEDYVWNEEDWCGNSVGALQAKCPFGKVGDVLWCREKWRCNHLGGMRIEYAAGGCCLEYEDWPSDAIPPYAMPTSASRVSRAERQLNGEKIPDSWRPSIHLPQWASRLKVQVEAVRCELDGVWRWLGELRRIE